MCLVASRLWMAICPTLAFRNTFLLRCVSSNRVTRMAKTVICLRAMWPVLCDRSYRWWKRKRHPNPEQYCSRNMPCCTASSQCPISAIESISMSCFLRYGMDRKGESVVRFSRRRFWWRAKTPRTNYLTRLETPCITMKGIVHGLRWRSFHQILATARIFQSLWIKMTFVRSPMNQTVIVTLSRTTIAFLSSRNCVCKTRERRAGHPSELFEFPDVWKAGAIFHYACGGVRWGVEGSAKLT